MITAWIIYSLLVGGLLYAAALAAEVVCRGLGAPTRFVWAIALAFTIGLSGSALRATNARATSPTPVRAAALGTATGTSVPHAVVPPQAARPSWWHSAIQSLRAATNFVAGVLDPNALAPVARFDRSIDIAASLSAVAAIAYLVAMLIRLRRVAREFELVDLDGHRVLVSEDVGPALIGMFRPRIVVPRWVLSLNSVERRDILAHEREHASAGDPALAIGAALFVALLPWNVGIWGLFCRLRLAIEADCDARVLRSQSDVRQYGALLLTVYERTVGSRTPRLAFVERRSHLEERIRRLAGRAPRLHSVSGGSAIMASVILAIAACETTAPSKRAGDSGSGGRVTATAERGAVVFGEEPRCLRWNQAKGGDAPSFDEIKSWAKARHPDVMASPRGQDAVIGLLLDENCAIVSDTVLDIPIKARAGWPNRFLSEVFGDTTGFARPRGMVFDYPRPGETSRAVTIAFGVRPGQEWQSRLSRNECGFGIRFNEQCSIQGPLELRMLDSVRALIAVRRFRAPNQPVDHLFLVTLAHPNPALKTLSMLHGVVSFQGGAVYVEDFNARWPLWLFAPSTTNGLADLKHKRDVQVFSDLVGVAHYNAGRLTLEQIPKLVPARSCDGPKGSCYEANGQTIRFPA